MRILRLSVTTSTAPYWLNIIGPTGRPVCRPLDRPAKSRAIRRQRRVKVADCLTGGKSTVGGRVPAVSCQPLQRPRRHRRRLRWLPLCSKRTAGQACRSPVACRSRPLSLCRSWCDALCSRSSPHRRPPISETTSSPSPSPSCAT